MQFGQCFPFSLVLNWAFFAFIGHISADLHLGEAELGVISLFIHLPGKKELKIRSWAILDVLSLPTTRCLCRAVREQPGPLHVLDGL